MSENRSQVGSERDANDTDSGSQPPAETVILNNSTAAEHPSPVSDEPDAPTERAAPEVGEPPVTGAYDPATAQTMDFARLDDESVVYEVRPVKKMPKSIGVYDIRRELGRGGMGVVYLARHRVLGRDVALKMVLDATHADADQLVRFITEARAVAHLQHPNIVQIFEVGEHDDLPFFSLEYINGPSLKERAGGKPLPPEEAAMIVEKLARAMQYAHDNQVLHRDLKPANVLMTKAGVPKIGDFGLAKRLSDEGDSASTRTGTVMGTPSYMSPEQARGETKTLTAATDQYSLGAVLYELLTGRPPFLASRAVDTILQVIREEPVPPRRTQPNLSADLETICLKALQKEPHKRYVDCAAFADDLHRYLVGEPILARRVSNIERTRRWCRRNPKLAALGLTSILLLIAVIAILSSSTAILSKKNSLIAEQNTQLQRSTNFAKSQQKIAERERGIALEEKKVAIDQASLALETIQTLIDKVMREIGDTPNTQTLKKSLLETAIAGAERVTEHNQQTSREATILAARQKLGELYSKLGESDKAFEQYEIVYRETQKRAETQGGTEASRLNAAAASLLMSDMYRELKRDLAGSQRLLEEAITRYQEILDNPKPGYGAIPPYRTLLGMQSASNRLAVLFVRLGDPSKALNEFRRAHELLQKVSATLDDDELQFASIDPSVREKEMAQRQAIKPALPSVEATAVLAIGGMLHRLRRPEEAEPYYRNSVEIRQRLYDQNPNDPGAKFQLARVLGMQGEFRFQNGITEGVGDLYRRYAELAKELADADPKMADYRRDLGIAHYRLGQFYQRQKDESRAREEFERCRALREELVEKNAPNMKRQMEYMLALAHCGEHVAANQLAEELGKGTPDNELLLDLSRCYAQCFASVKDQPELAQQYKQKSLAMLNAARQAGYNDTFNLEVDADLDPLHDDPEFQRIVKAPAVSTDQ